jgi:hypothetical protein
MGKAVDGADGLFECGALAAQLLGVFGAVPDRGIFQFAGDFRQAFTLDVVVKDTPSGHRGALAYP